MPTRLAFGPFVADLEARLLLHGGAVKPLAPRAFRLLTVLLERAGEVVPKDDLFAEVWPEQFVEENNLAQAIRSIRRALDDTGRPSRYLQTVAGRGYRFMPSAPVTYAPHGPLLPHRPPPPTLIIVGHFEWIGTPDRMFSGLLGPGLESATLTRLANEPVVSVRRLCNEHPLPDGAVVLEGSIRRVDDCIRIDVRLVNADGVVKWGQSFDGCPSGVLAAEDFFSTRIARAVSESVGSGSTNGRGPFDDTTYFAYLRARYLLGRRTRAALLEAVELFTQAVSSERLTALAWLGLAEAYALLGEYDYMPVRASLQEARAAATQALATGARGEAYTALAEAKLYCDWDLPGAEEDYGRALALEPRYATTHHWYGWYLVTRGRFDEGLAALHNAHSLDPHSLIVTSDLGWGLMCAGQFERSFEHLTHAKLMDRTFFLAPYYLAIGFIMRREYEAALEELREAAEIERNAQVVAYMGFALAMIGRADDAREHLRELQKMARSEYVSPYLISLVHAGLGEPSRALHWLAKAVNERAASLMWPGVDVLRSQVVPTAELDRLLGRSGFPDYPRAPLNSHEVSATTADT